MDAIITAGGIPLPGEPLYEYTRGKPKAMLEIAGKPMIQWVLDAIGRSSKIEHIVVIGLPELGGVTCIKPTSFIANQADMLSNIKAGMVELQKINPAVDYALIAASDVPGVTSDMIDWVTDQVEQSDADICYHVITRQVMENRYPNSKRTYTHLKDVDVCGGDINAIRVNSAIQVSSIWERLIANRKNPVQQASILGLNILFGLLFRTDNLDTIVKKISKRLGIIGKAIVCPYAEVGMDVDKPHQLEIMRSDMAGRQTA
jgi:GTP:adenosylcobinamide-phosphate guanylyltransferase